MEWRALGNDSAASDALSYINVKHSKLLSKGLYDLRNEAIFCDVILRVGRKTFSAHKCVLATFSPYFKAMFTSDMKESHDRKVTLKDIEPAVLESLLQFFYTGTINITEANVQSLVAASNLFQVLPVLDACSIFMAKHMDASNCLSIQCFAENMNCKKLLETAKEFALSNLLDLADHDEFLNLPLAKVMELVSSDALEVTREEDVFTAVLKWFNHQPEARKDDFHKVLECVRLPLMSPHFLHDSVSKQAIMQTSPECVTLLQDALLYQLLPDRREEMQSPRARPRSTKITDVIVCVGGRGTLSRLRCLEAFDPASNQWTLLCDLPYSVRDHQVVVTEQNVLYVAGGSAGNVCNNRLLKFAEFHRISASTSAEMQNKWEEKANMSCARAGHGLAVLDRFIYAIGGHDDTSLHASVERYNIETNQWEQMPPLQTATTDVTVFAHGGYLYVAGGQLINSVPVRSFQRFDPRTRAWTNMAPMLNARSGAAGCALDGKLYIIGGYMGGIGATTDVECYDVLNNQWTACAPLGTGRGFLGAVVMSGYIYVLGGLHGRRTRRLSSVERYSPRTGRWENAAEMTMAPPRSGTACVVLKIRKSLLPSGRQ